jgi:pantetheine-phosphate adenylyltransferase
MKIAVFPGSFDPITIGHYDLIIRSLSLFDKVIVAIGTNSVKSYLFPLETRIEWLREVFKGNEKIEIDHLKA